MNEWERERANETKQMWIWCEFEWTSSGFANSSGAVSAVVDGVRELTGAVMRSACIVLDNRNIPNEFFSIKKKQRFFPAIVSHVIRLNQTPIVLRTSYQVNLKYATMKTNKLKTTWNERVGSTTAASMPGKRSSPAPTTIKTGGCLIFIVFGIRTFSKRDGTARCVSPHANAEYFSLDTFHVPERPQPDRFNQQRRRRKHSDIGLMRQYSGGWFSNGYKCLWFFAVAVVASNPLFSRRKTHCRDANIMRILSVCLGFAYLQCVRNFTNNNRKNHQQQQRLPIRWWCEWWNADTGRSACGANEQRQMRSPQIFFKAAGDAAGFVCCSVPVHISACSFRLRFTVWIDYLLSFSLNSQAEKCDSLIKIVPQIHRNQFIIQNHRSSVNKFIIFFLRPKIPFETKKSSNVHVQSELAEFVGHEWMAVPLRTFSVQFFSLFLFGRFCLPRYDLSCVLHAISSTPSHLIRIQIEITQQMASNRYPKQHTQQQYRAKHKK